MEPVVTQNPDGTWKVVSQEGNVERTNFFTQDWVFTNATEVETTPGRVATMHYNANYAMTDATIVKRPLVSRHVRSGRSVEPHDLDSLRDPAGRQPAAGPAYSTGRFMQSDLRQHVVVRSHV